MNQSTENVRSGHGTALAAVALGLAGSLLASDTALGETIVIRSGQFNGQPGIRHDPDDTVMVIDISPGSMMSLGGLNFAPAFTGQPAVVVQADGAWLDELSVDADARWINHASHPISGRGLPPRSVLYACDFVVQTGCVGNATIDFCWAADDRLGDVGGAPIDVGVYLNGVTLSSDFLGGGIGVETCASQSLPAGLLQSGPNTLYIYQRDTSDSVSGVLFNATITVDDTCPTDVGGRLFHDLDADGVEDAGEPPLADWTIALTDAMGNVTTTTTDGTGAYAFPVDPCASYRIEPVVEPCWSRTTFEFDVYAGPCSSTAIDLGVTDVPGAAEIDQEMAEVANSCVNITFVGPLAQEFLAGAASYSGVDLLISSGGGSGSTDPITLNVRDGSPTGPIVASATVVPNVPPFGPSAWVHFPISFSAAPAQTYVLEISTPNGAWMWCGSGVNEGNVNTAYPDGIGYALGDPAPHFDWGFRLWVENECEGCLEFAPDDTYGTGQVPQSLEAGDFDGDGDLDLVVATHNNDSVSVLMNNGDGTFAPDILYGVGAGPLSVAVGDLNGDGDPDLAVANHNGNNVSVLLNNGNGTFAPDVLYGVGTWPRAVAVGDLDADGDLDLAVTNEVTDDVSVLLNTGTGTFAAAVHYGAGNAPVEVAIGDLDGDGRNDLAVANLLDNTASVLLNTGGGTFGADVPYGTGLRPASVTLADVDGDGRLDLIVANYITEDVSVLLNTGAGTFAPEVRYGVTAVCCSTIAEVRTGDMDGDGDLDLVVVMGGSTGVTSHVSVLSNNGDGTFGAESIFSVGEVPISVAIGDLNGDGHLDLAVANHLDDNVSVLLSNCETQTSPADFDGDGAVGFGDLTALLANWGPCAAPCPYDLDGNGAVGFTDLTTVLGAWSSGG